MCKYYIYLYIYICIDIYIYTYIYGSRTFHPFCGSPPDGSPLYRFFFHPHGWFTSRMIHPSYGFTPGQFTPRTFHPPDVSPHGRFTPRTFHPPQCSPPEMFTPSEYLSFSRRIKIMYKTNQISDQLSYVWYII